MRRIIGIYEKLGDIDYFIPYPLPPKDPLLQLSPDSIELYGEAMLQLGKLNEMIAVVPDVPRFIKAYVIKEALLSSSIEGINTTMLDVFTQPYLTSKPKKETQLVMNYVKALYSSIQMIKDGLPISSRVILQAHKDLMSFGEGDKANPGHYRRSNVKVGNLVPAPFAQVPKLMSLLESYINSENIEYPLIMAGLAHVQFEMIHPFLDGNGRIGRLLIVLILIEQGLLHEPILYPSYYLKKHHKEYYDRLERVRTDGDFEGWVHFYLLAIKESCIDAYQRAKKIEQLRHDLIEKIKIATKSSKNIENMLLALDVLFRYPVISVTELSEQLDVAYNTANAIIKNFLSLHILVKQTEQKRYKLFRFESYLAILE